MTTPREAIIVTTGELDGNTMPTGQCLGMQYYYKRGFIGADGVTPMAKLYFRKPTDHTQYCRVDIIKPGDKQFKYYQVYDIFWDETPIRFQDVTDA